jgi:hypothetical protein
MTTFTPICMLAVALATSLTPVMAPAATTDQREATGEFSKPGILRVGAQRALKRPSAAALIAHDGDIIEIDAGNYDGDAGGV